MLPFQNWGHFTIFNYFGKWYYDYKIGVIKNEKKVKKGYSSGICNCNIIGTEKAEEETEFYEWLKNSTMEKEELYNHFKQSRAALPPTAYLKVVWQQQINGYYCGPATAAMILKDIGYVHVTQPIIAGQDYLRTTTDGTPWYSGLNQTSIYYFNMAYGLNQYQYDNLSQYVKIYSYSVCNNNNTDEYVEKMMYALSNENPVPLFGRATKNSGISSQYLNAYTQSNHWLVLQGYSGNGNFFLVVDPASGIPGFESQPKTYTCSKADILKFATNGVIW